VSNVVCRALFSRRDGRLYLLRMRINATYFMKRANALKLSLLDKASDKIMLIDKRNVKGNHIEKIALS